MEPNTYHRLFDDKWIAGHLIQLKENETALR